MRNVPQRLMYLNPGSPDGGAVWEGLGSMALVEEDCHWGRALSVCGTPHA